MSQTICGHQVRTPPGITLSEGKSCDVIARLRTFDAHDALREFVLEGGIDIPCAHLLDRESFQIYIRTLLIELVCHEVDEWLTVDGIQVTEPHPVSGLGM